MTRTTHGLTLQELINKKREKDPNYDNVLMEARKRLGESFEHVPGSNPFTVAMLKAGFCRADLMGKFNIDLSTLHKIEEGHAETVSPSLVSQIYKYINFIPD